MKPDFICIGAQKAGTTWLYQRLRDHPEFSMPQLKEIHYFDRSKEYPSSNALSESNPYLRILKRDYSRVHLNRFLNCLKAGNLKRAKWWARFFFGSYSDEWYRSIFEPTSNLAGDITPSYSILGDDDVRRMRDAQPEAKILFLIRNPIDRAWSMYRFCNTFKCKLESRTDEQFKSFMNSRAQQDRSNYQRTIELFLKHYPAESFLVGYYDAIKADPGNLMTAVLEHFGAKDLNLSTDLDEVNNKSQVFQIPQEHHAFLCQKYRPEIESLSERFGGYATRWLRALDGQGEGSEPCSPIIKFGK